MTMRYVRNNAYPAAELQGKVVMINDDASKYFRLNRMGSFIWDRLGKPTEETEIVNEILKECPVDRETCEAGVREFLDKMVQRNLIVACPSVN